MIKQRIMYVCSECAEGCPEACGHYDRTELRVMPDGAWLCESCFDNNDDNEFLSWGHLPAPEEYRRIPDSAQDAGMRDALEKAQKIIEREFPNGQTAIDIRNALAAKPPATPGETEVEDTWLVGGPPDLKAMSGSVESDRVIQLHFRRRVTDDDRKWLLDAINLKIRTDKEASQHTEGENPIGKGLRRTQEVMCAADMEAKIAALAHRFWSIHPSTLDDMNMTREEFYAHEMTKLLASSLPEGQPASPAEDCSEQAQNDRLFELDQPYDAETTDGWNPISTAPKDGPAFLVWVPENKCIYEVIARDSNLSIFGGGFRDNLWRATHWMPLPTPPSHPSTTLCRPSSGDGGAQ